MDNNQKEGHVISGPGCRIEIESIMRGRNARRHAYERAVRVMMTRGIVEEEGEGEVEEEGARDEWIEKRVTMERFEVSLFKAKAGKKGTGVDGWSDYLLKRASKGVKIKYYEVIKEMMVTRKFPEEWNEWTATFAMKPGDLESKLGQDCLIEAWYIAKIRAKIQTDRITGDEEWRKRWGSNGREKKIR